MSISVALELVSVQTSETDGSIPSNQARIQLQDATGNVVQLLVEDPVTVGEILAVWQPYKDAVDAAIENETEWPKGPLYSVVIAQLP